MPNHVHLLITVGREMTIEKAMQLIKGGFSFLQRRNWIPRRDLAAGFSDVQIKDEESLAVHRLYIHYNPVKAGLVNEAEEYTYSSLYLRRLKAQGLKPGTQTARIGATEVVP